MTLGPTGGAASGQADAAPVCPRHPDEVSYVRCQRCERPVCPRCQRPAAVGVQCVDCVKEQGRTVRGPRTVFGGRAGPGRPVVTQSIIALCVVIFLFQWSGSGITSRLDFEPYLAISEPYRFLTAAFLHSPSFVLHIVMNMYALWLLGPYLENLLGPVRFAALYLISALGGQVLYFLLASPGVDNPHWTGGALGASGAVFGLFAALLILNRRLGRDTGGVIGVIGINLVIGFWPGLNIAWQAHLGGLITGAAVSLLLAWRPPETSSVRRGTVQAAALVGVLVLLVGLTAAKVATVPSGLLA